MKKLSELKESVITAVSNNKFIGKKIDKAERKTRRQIKKLKKNAKKLINDFIKGF